MIGFLLSALLGFLSVISGSSSNSPTGSSGTQSKANQEDDTASSSTPQQKDDDSQDTNLSPGKSNDKHPDKTDDAADFAPNDTPDNVPPPTTESSATQITGPDAVAGRVLKITPDDHDDIASIRILEGPEFGNVSVNPDNTLALVLTTSDTTGALSYDYEVTYKDGTTETFESNHTVTQGTQDAGWGEGQVYMLETDADDNVVVETGDIHRPVYMSNSSEALSRADIAALEGLEESAITDNWLVAHPEYGGSEDMALNPEAGMGVWSTLTTPKFQGSLETSHWLLFERGYEYEDLGRVVGWGASGEDELHPLHLTAYGSGEDPVIKTPFKILGGESHNVVVTNLNLDAGGYSLSGHNVLFDNINLGDGLAFQSGSGFTFRNSEAFDVVRDTPVNGGTHFEAGNDRITGIYVSGTDGILLEGNVFDHTGWVDGYAFDGEAAYGQAPSQYSHNFYLQPSALDVTFRDNITMRAAATGAQFRGGGFIEDNVFLDNNVAVNFLGGDYMDGGTVSNYTLFTDNVITSGAHKIAQSLGGLTMGATNRGADTTLLDNIIAHLSDPNNPDEQAEKEWTHAPLDSERTPYYDDTMIYNWVGAGAASRGANNDVNVDGLDSAVLDQTTIQLFTAALLGKPDATIADLGDYLRAQADGALDKVVDADLIIAFFQQGFGITVDARLQSETLRFVPNELGEGIRWDNRLNWDTEDLPGTFDGDSVDLAGNWVNYGGTTRIADLDFGSGGKLNVTHGKLTIEEATLVGARGGEFNIDDAGQVWMNGYTDTDALTINVAGGRFANTGEMTGHADLNVSGGQAILAKDDGHFDVGQNQHLHIDGNTAKVGFDDNDGDIGVLRFQEGSALNFTADSEGLSTITEFRSGAMGDTPDAQSGVHLGQATLEIDLSELDDPAGEHMLISVDALIGKFEDVNLIGLSSTHNAELVVDYDLDEVFLRVTDGGNGKFSMSSTGDAKAGLTGSDLWTALTDGQPPLSDADFTKLYLDDVDAGLEAEI